MEKAVLNKSLLCSYCCFVAWEHVQLGGRSHSKWNFVSEIGNVHIRAISNRFMGSELFN